MSQILKRFVSRSPRYVLRPSDNRMMRFAPNKIGENSFSTRYVNVSETGLAFVVPKRNAPRIGEIIKVEIPVGEENTLAWFARVARLEEYGLAKWWDEEMHPQDEGEVLVGLEFYELPEGHKVAIRNYLQEKFVQVVREHRLRALRSFTTFLRENGWRLVAYALSALLTFAVLYFLSRPSYNYDAERGSPWGQRFKFGP